MSIKDRFRKVAINLLKKFLAAPELTDQSIGTPQKILVIRQHNQFGDLLASVSLLRAIKESFPSCHLTLIASVENHQAVIKNEFIDNLVIYDRRKLLSPAYITQFKKILRKDYDLAIVPATVAVSLTSCIIAAFSKAKIKIGPGILNGDKNDLAYVFHHRINLDWRKCPDAHVSDFTLDIVRPFGIKTRNFKSSVSFTENDIKTADEFLETFGPGQFSLLIGFHIGAGKQQNRWSLFKYAGLIERIQSKYKIKFYFTGSKADSVEIDFMENHFDNHCGFFIDRTIPQLAALIDKSNFFITNDTGVMHVAGTTGTPQISLFGPTNPFNWAPIGPEKFFIRKSELIDDISVNDVYNLFELIVGKQKSNDGKK